VGLVRLDFLVAEISSQPATKIFDIGLTILQDETGIPFGDGVGRQDYVVVRIPSDEDFLLRSKAENLVAGLSIHLMSLNEAQRLARRTLKEMAEDFLRPVLPVLLARAHLTIPVPEIDFLASERRKVLQVQACSGPRERLHSNRRLASASPVTALPAASTLSGSVPKI
jgi:hypothetical protein